VTQRIGFRSFLVLIFASFLHRPIRRQLELGADAGTTLRMISDWIFLI
jgi:hypothetical protein